MDDVVEMVSIVAGLNPDDYQHTDVMVRQVMLRCIVATSRPGKIRVKRDVVSKDVKHPVVANLDRTSGQVTRW